MTLSSSESLADPGAISSERLAITRTYRLVDTSAAMEAGLAVGAVAGFAQGYPIGLDRGTSDGEALGFARGSVLAILPLPAGYDRGYADGLEAGRRAALGDGMTIGRAAGYFAGELAGLGAGEALGLVTGIAIAPGVVEDDEAPVSEPDPLVPIASTLEVGDPEYVDIVAEGIARLPWQFARIA